MLSDPARAWPNAPRSGQIRSSSSKLDLDPAEARDRTDVIRQFHAAFDQLIVRRLLEQHLQHRLRFETRQVGSQAAVRPDAERQVTDILPPEIYLMGILIFIGIPIGRRVG